MKIEINEMIIGVISYLAASGFTIYELLKLFIKKNNSFSVLVSNFKLKLPYFNKAEILNDSEKENLSIVSPTLKHATVVNTSTHKQTCTESDINEFYNRINSFNFWFVVYTKKYKLVINNLNRFKPTANNKDFDAITVQLILEKYELDPWKIFKNGIKCYTRKIFKAVIKKNNK